ncbi:MAG: OmpA family protein [Chitinophagaceae bacterium]
MKQFLILCALFISINGYSQALKRLADRAKQKVENVAGNKVDGAVDNAANGKGTKKTGDNNGADTESDDEESVTTKPKSESLQAYSKYDFVPGEKIIAFDNFERAEIGDFPTNWNTNGSAEVVTVNVKEGKWMKINNSGYFHAEFIKNIPDNSTLEFDLGVNNNFQWGSSNFYVHLTHVKEKGNFSSSGYYDHTLNFEFHPLTGGGQTSGGVHFHTSGETANLNNHNRINNWDNKSNLFAHVSLWRQGQRLRMYVNGNKMFDLPKAFEPNGNYTDLIFYTNSIQKESDYYLLGNIRLATGAPDTRNKLVTEGKWVTRGILFDVNSDKLKPESFGTLKEIAGVLKDNPSIKVKIVGHTDSDGDDKANLELSKKRAAAVKTALVKEFGIDEGNLETDGKGEGEPVDKNTTSEGKANNRRVEFFKM